MFRKVDLVAVLCGVVAAYPFRNRLSANPRKGVAVKTKGLARYVSIPLLVAAMLLTAGSVLAQEMKKTDNPLPAQAQTPVGGAAKESGIKVPAGGFPPLTPALTPQAKGSPTTPCPVPFTLTKTGPGPDISPPDAGDFGSGSIYTNATFGSIGLSSVPSFFGATFRLPKLPPCCTYDIPSTATLTVVYFARIPTGTVGGANSSNDTGGLVENGTFVPGSYGFIGTNGGTAPALWSGSKTVIYNVPSSVLNSTTVSFQASDNATVVSAKLIINGCCR